MIIMGRNVRSVPVALCFAAMAGLVGIGLSIVPASAAGPVPKAGDVTELAVKKALTDALIVNQQLGVPPSQGDVSLRPLAAEKTDKQAAVRQGIPSDADRQASTTRDRKKIKEHFASPALVARENQTVDNVMAAVKDPSFRFLGAGVSQVDFTSVTVSAGVATAVVRTHEWSKFEQKDPDGNWVVAAPTGEMIYKATLSLGPAGTWVVTDLKGDFAPGFAP